MCGIAGWINFHDNLSEKRDILENMVKTVISRGPDSSGYWISEHAALGHRRLIVVDPAGGIQPMVRNFGDNTYIQRLPIPATRSVVPFHTSSTSLTLSHRPKATYFSPKTSPITDSKLLIIFGTRFSPPGYKSILSSVADVEYFAIFPSEYFCNTATNSDDEEKF